MALQLDSNTTSMCLLFLWKKQIKEVNEEPAKTIKTEDVENIIQRSAECTPGPDVHGAKRTDVLPTQL